VGATDDLASGQSTFMVEMSEVANIVKNATTNSFIILDELGRGTSTFDGLSIAWAVTEYISSHLNARTLVATHYHELTELEGKIKGIKNYCITVKEDGEDIIFLRKIVRGGADESYGINVAKLAGVPKNITERADEILRQLEESDISKRATRIRNKDKSIGGQLDLLGFNSVLSEKDKIISELAEINLQELTPIEALNVIYKLQQKIADSKLL
jgi:DNA mismatch repair protein MutS